MIAVFTFAITLGPIGQKVHAMEVNNGNDEKLIKEVAEQLEFLWNEGAIKNEKGEIIYFDIGKIQSKYGSFTSNDQEALNDILEFNTHKMIQEIQKENTNTNIMSRSAAVDACVNKKISDYIAGFAGPAIFAAIYEMMSKSQFSNAARELIKIGFKGNVWAIAGTLSTILITCIKSEEGWI